MTLSAGTTLMSTQAIGTIGSSVGSYFSASGSKAALEAQASIADTNSKIATLKANSAIQQGQKEEQSVLLRGAQMKSTERASMAANGIDLGSDTAQNIVNSTDVMKESDANTVAANALRTAWGYKNEALSYSNDALMKRTSAKGINPWQSAGSTLLTGASSMMTNAYMLNKAGAFDKDSWGFMSKMFGS